MYSREDALRLSDRARELLKETQAPGTAAELEETLRSLREVIRFQDWRYYVQSDPVLSDFDYDRLFARLRDLEQAHPGLVTPDSPTQRVAQGLTREFVTVSHLVPMLSLENSYNEQDLLDWDRRARELSGEEELDYCVEPKFDGAGISLVYEEDLLVRGATRGDGVQGEDISVNIRQIRSVPLSARFSAYGIRQIEIRGEVLIYKEPFRKFNEQRMADGLPPLANPRNAASGSLRMVDPREVGKRGLHAVLYHMSHYLAGSGDTPVPALETHEQTIRMLDALGFDSPWAQLKKFKGIDKVVAYCREMEQKRDGFPFEMDGMVVKVNQYRLQDLMGMTTHHPRWAIAFKFKARQASSRLLQVEFQVGRTGAITPVAKIEPVAIGGVTVSSVSLFNEDMIREKDLRIGDRVLVERAGDVIPYIVKSVPDLRDGTQKKIRFPRHCPVCHAPLQKPEGESVWRCANINCEAQVLERIIHFVSKDALDIRSLGEANIRKFFKLGLLRDIPGIYELDFDRIRELEGFGEKSAGNLKKSLELSLHQPLHRLIYGLGIRYVGEATARTLAQAVEDLSELQNLSLDQLLELEDIGPKVAGSILEFFSNAQNRELIRRLRELGLNLKRQKEDQPALGDWSGIHFLFTGTLPTLKRSEAEALVESRGASLASGVSSKLDYLVTGEEPGSKLEKAKKIPGIRILNEAEFLHLIEGEKDSSPTKASGPATKQD